MVDTHRAVRPIKAPLVKQLLQDAVSQPVPGEFLELHRFGRKPRPGQRTLHSQALDVTNHCQRCIIEGYDCSCSCPGVTLVDNGFLVDALSCDEEGWACNVCPAGSVEFWRGSNCAEEHASRRPECRLCKKQILRCVGGCPISVRDSRQLVRSLQKEVDAIVIFNSGLISHAREHIAGSGLCRFFRRCNIAGWFEDRDVSSAVRDAGGCLVREGVACDSSQMRVFQAAPCDLRGAGPRVTEGHAGACKHLLVAQVLNGTWADPTVSPPRGYLVLADDAAIVRLERLAALDRDTIWVFAAAERPAFAWNYGRELQDGYWNFLSLPVIAALEQDLPPDYHTKYLRIVGSTTSLPQRPPVNTDFFYLPAYAADCDHNPFCWQRAAPIFKHCMDEAAIGPLAVLTSPSWRQSDGSDVNLTGITWVPKGQAPWQLWSLSAAEMKRLVMDPRVMMIHPFKTRTNLITRRLLRARLDAWYKKYLGGAHSLGVGKHSVGGRGRD